MITLATLFCRNTHKITFIIDYTNYADFRDHLKNIKSLTTMTTLIFKNTSKKLIIDYAGIGVLQDYVKNSAIIDYANYIIMKDYYS